MHIRAQTTHPAVKMFRDEALLQRHVVAPGIARRCLPTRNLPERSSTELGESHHNKPPSLVFIPSSHRSINQTRGDPGTNSPRPRDRGKDWYPGPCPFTLGDKNPKGGGVTLLACIFSSLHGWVLTLTSKTKLFSYTIPRKPTV